MVEHYPRIDRFPKDINIGFAHIYRSQIPEEVIAQAEEIWKTEHKNK